MTWVDFAIAVLLVGAVALEIKRGFGAALFDALAVVISMRAAYLLVNPDTGVFKAYWADVPAHAGFGYLFAFIGFCVVTLFIAHLIYGTLLFSADVFDPLLGGIMGIVVGVTICHVLVSSLTMMELPGGGENAVKYSAFAPELLNFTMYHNVLNLMETLGQ
jgi:uncharacterized membrane protein required for colicin V production